MEKQIINTLEQRKESAEIMGNFFAIIAVLYIVFIAYLAFTKEYESLLLAINVWILLVIVAVDNKNEKKNAERLLKNIKYFESLNERIEYISRNNPWISVEERLPEDNKVVLLWLGGCYKVALLRDNKWWECTGYYTVCGWSALDALSTTEVEYITHWMPIPEV